MDVTYQKNQMRVHLGLCLACSRRPDSEERRKGKIASGENGRNLVRYSLVPSRLRSVTECCVTHPLHPENLPGRVGQSSSALSINEIS